MKKFTITFFIFLCSISTFAQLKVESNGYVKIENAAAIGTNNNGQVALNVERVSRDATPTYGLKATLKTRNTAPTGSIYGIYSLADASATTSGQPVGPVVGVCGKAIKSNATSGAFSVGVAGIADYYNGIGVYGATGTQGVSLPSSNLGAVYAGYFAGSVKITGSLMVNTTTYASDYRLKHSIQDLDNSLWNNFLSLRPVSYYFNNDSNVFAYEDNSPELQVQHYGLVAQEVQSLFPNLVQEDANGYLSINYIELIPVLIQSLQVVNARVEELEQQVNALTSAPLRVQGRSNELPAVLYQNTPNPTTGATTIAYQLPGSVTTAHIYVYDMNGTQLASYPLTNRGESTLTIAAGEFGAGMYLYTLIADGEVIDTKRMIITE